MMCIPIPGQSLMKKIFGAVLLSVFGCVFPSQGQLAYPTAGTTPAAGGHDPVRHCLDLVQLNVAGKIAPALPVTSHPVQSPPKDLPLQCLAGNLDGNQKRFKESNRKLRKKIGRAKGSNIPVRLPNGEKRGLLPERQCGDAENREPAEHGLRHLRESGSAGV